MNVDPNLAEIESIEDYLIDNKNFVSSMSKTYGKFLLNLINEGGFGDRIASADLETIRTCIENRDFLLSAGREAESLNYLRMTEKNARDSNSDLSQLARCVIHSYIKDEDWNDETAQDRSPLYLFLIGIRKIIPDIGPKFIDFFKAELLPRS